MEKQISISLIFIKNVKDAVIKKLKCKDDFELHKTFEGLLYYKKHLKKLVGIYFVEKMFGITLINKNELLNYKDEFQYKNINYKILVFEPDENITIKSVIPISYILLHVFNEYKYIKLIGIVESGKINGNILNLNEIKKYIK